MEKILKANNDNILKISEPASEKKSGISFNYNNEKRILTNNYHSLVIGEDEVQNENKVIIPLINQIIDSEESFVINTKGDNLYKKYEDKLKQQGYKTIYLNFDDLSNSDCFNILELAYNRYKNNNKDKAIELLENIGYYLFYDEANKNSDPFWINSAISLFIGSTLFLLEKDEDVSLDKIDKLVDTIKIEDINKDSSSYKYLSSILLAPEATKGSIISVFKQRFKLFTSRENLNKILSKSTFDIININQKMAIFIVEGVSFISNIITPIFINQIYYVTSSNRNDKKINLIVNNFDDISPIKNIESIIIFLTCFNVNITAFIKNFTRLNKNYGIESVEVLKFYFKNLIYLYSDDLATLEFISKICGSTEYMTDLRNIKENEALFIIVRNQPFIINI